MAAHAMHAEQHTDYTILVSDQPYNEQKRIPQMRMVASIVSAAAQNALCKIVPSSWTCDKRFKCALQRAGSRAVLIRADQAGCV